MAGKLVYETVCPSCSTAFELAEDATEGRCPHCDAYLRFVPDDVAVFPEPEPVAEPEAAADTAPAPEGPAPASAPRIGEFQVECPACNQLFNVAATSDEADCPNCQARVTLENQYAERGLEFPVECPECHQLHEVPLDSHKGHCPHCNASLTYEDLLAEQAPPEAPPAPEPELVAPPTPEPIAEHLPKTRRRTQPEPPPAPTPGSAEPELPLAKVEPEGIPLSIDCPSCKKTFGVPAKAREGNCPHCNAPLAFVSEKEYQGLLAAEEAKKRFQQKMQERRQRERAEALAQQKAAEDQATGGPVAPKPSLLSFLKRTKKEPPAGTPALGAPPAEALAVEITVEPAPASKPTKRKKKIEEPAVAVEAAPIEISAAPMEAATEPAKRGRFAFLRREKRPEPAGGALATVEADVGMLEIEAPASEAAPTKPKRGKKQEPPTAIVELSAEPTVELSEPTIELSSEPVAAPPKKKGKKDSPALAPVEVSMDPGLEILAEAAPANGPAPTKKGLFSRFRKEKAPDSAPLASIEVEDVGIEMAAHVMPAAPAKGKKGKKPAPEPATVEVAEIGMEFSADVPPEPKPRKGRREPPAPATVEVADIGFESAIEAAPPPAKPGKKGKAATQSPAAVIETGEIVFEASAPTAPAEAEVSIDMGDAPAQPARKGRRR